MVFRRESGQKNNAETEVGCIDDGIKEYYIFSLLVHHVFLVLFYKNVIL